MRYWQYDDEADWLTGSMDRQETIDDELRRRRRPRRSAIIIVDLHYAEIVGART